MARRLIGLDVGTNAVSLAEVAAGATPELRAFGQVALPPDAMREGEVVDEGAVAEAVARLRSEMGLKRGRVRVGVASPRVIVRQVDMPTMTESELRSALQFQAQDLIPIPIDEAVLDFAVLGESATEDGEATTRVLLAAAHESTVSRLVRAVEGGGFAVHSVDLVPLALIRCLAHPTDEDGAEGIVSFGGGVTCVAVHERGLPAFVRVLGTGGRALTDAIAADLEIPLETAESLKRQLGSVAGADDAVERAGRAVDRPLGALLDEIRSSIDYYRNQPGAVRLRRVVVTGGGAQLPGLVDRLASLVGVPVEPAMPRAELRVGDIGFDPDELHRLDPYLPAPVGLALGPVLGPAVDLLRMPSRPGARRTRVAVAGAVAALVLLVGLGFVTLQRQHQIDDAKASLTAAQRTNSELESEIAALADAQAKQARVEATRTEVRTLLASDVSWSRMLQEIARTIPDDVWLASFQGSVDTQGLSAAASAAAPGSTVRGTVAFSATGLDFPSVASWLTRVAEMPSLDEVWVPNASRTTYQNRDVVSFSSNASLTDDARSDRVDTLLGESP